MTPADPRVLTEIRGAPAPLRHLIVATLDDAPAIGIAVQIRSTTASYVTHVFTEGHAVALAPANQRRST